MEGGGRRKAEEGSGKKKGQAPDAKSSYKKALQEMIICVKCWKQSIESMTRTLTHRLGPKEDTG